MRTGLLLGRDHHDLGAVEAVSEGSAAIALSKGGARKTYEHTHPNEDASAFALGAGAGLVVVADGHRGCEASELALRHLLERVALSWTSPGGVDARAWPDEAVAALCDANRDILRERGEMCWARTTLSLALVLPEQDLLLTASVGDSHCFRVGPQTVQDLARGTEAQSHFLGHEPETASSMAKKCRTEAHPLGDTRAVVLATDGLSERGLGVADPPRVVLDAVDRAARSLVDLRPLEIARDVVEAALAAQHEQKSGDNAAAAVIWVP